MDELRELLRNVSDTYDDFVDGVCCIVKKHKECLVFHPLINSTFYP